MHGLTISERGRYDKELGLVIRKSGGNLFNYVLLIALTSDLEILEKELYNDQKNKFKKYCS